MPAGVGRPVRVGRPARRDPALELVHRSCSARMPSRISALSGARRLSCESIWSSWRVPPRGPRDQGPARASHGRERALPLARVGVRTSLVARTSAPASDQEAEIVDMKFEVAVIPVSDVDRARDFYRGLGWRLDAGFSPGPDFRVVQLTPPGSACAIIFGTGSPPPCPAPRRACSWWWTTPGGLTRTGRTGTPGTWWPIRPRRARAHERLRRDRRGRRASTAPANWPTAACGSPWSSGN